MKKTPVIYDVGLHDGEDSAYYLAKGFRVVGIDADSAQCALCRGRFAREIASGRMHVLNVGVGAEEGMGRFFVSTRNPAVSTFVEPDLSGQEWELREVPVRKLSSIIDAFGEPHFVKIDVECYDHLVLRDLMTSGVRPRFISAESHVIDVFCMLVCMNYKKFRLVDGATIPERFGNHTIQTSYCGSMSYNFRRRSSGPFGEDLPDQWIDKEQCLKNLLQHGLGWIDIHATC